MIKFLFLVLLIVIAAIILINNKFLMILAFIIAVVIIFFKIRKMDDVDYSPDDDFLQLYEDLGFIEDEEKNKEYPQLAEIKEYKNYKIYRFFLNRNKVDKFQKGIDLIEEHLEEKVIDIKRDENNYKIVNIRATENKIEKLIPFTLKMVTQDSKIVIGYGYLGAEYFDLNTHYHIFICGEIGGGKSVCIKVITLQLIHKTIEGDNIILKIADFKGGSDYSKYKKHVEIVKDIKNLLYLTEDILKEMYKREKIIDESGHENFTEYNKNSKNKLKRIVLVIDEIVEALEIEGLDKKDDAEEIKIIKKIIKNLSRLARLCRAFGINLIFGTQIPTAKCIVNQIKNNIPIRVCYKFADKSASQVVLGSPIATTLPETKGRMIYKIGGEFRELQTPFVNNKMVEDYFGQYGDQIKISDLEIEKTDKANVTSFDEYKNEKSKEVDQEDQQEEIKLDDDFSDIEF